MYLSVMLAAAALAAAAAPDEQAILAAAAEAREAGRTCDVAKLDQILRDDFLAIDPSGKLRTKAEYLDMIRSIPPDLQAANAELQVSHRDVRVRFYGGAAVLTELRTAASLAGKSEARYIQVWVNDQGRWRLSTFQATRVAAAH